MTLRIAEHPLPDHFLVHISDTHFVMPGERLGGVADASAHLRALLATVADTGIRPEALVFTVAALTFTLVVSLMTRAVRELSSVAERVAADPLRYRPHFVEVPLPR